MLPILALFTLSLPGARADIHSDLIELRAHPEKVPAKTGTRHPRLATVDSDESLLRRKDAARQAMCTIRDGRQICLKDVRPGRAPFSRNDRVEDLVGYETHLVKNLEKMEKKGLRSGALDEVPWSDTYWPIFRGGIADRYADDENPASKDWKENWEFAHRPGHGLMEIFEAGEPDAVDLLSPAEKYDLLIGDDDGALTEANWSDGEGYYKESGKVEDWMGFCNGWAPAAFSLPRPTRAVRALAADGSTPLVFYPADLKALGTLLWAKADVNYNFLGGRCSKKRPRADENGRILDPDCFDTNPAAWKAICRLSNWPRLARQLLSIPYFWR
jgi:hypothetical protein